MKRINNIIHRVTQQTATVASATKVWLLKTDKRRWKKVSQVIPHWDERNRIIAGLIPDKVSVVDLGSGAQTMRKHLKRGCEYQPCDVIQSSPDVIHADFNSGIYPKLTKEYDFVVCSGVFEYMRDPNRFLSEIRHYGRTIIFSYNPYTDGYPRLKRLACGWVNHLTEAQLKELFSANMLEWKELVRKSTSPTVDEIIYELKIRA